jgi:hypothetical protein
MSIQLPTNIRAAIADPKGATDSALQSTLSFYDDEVHPDALELVAEELARRTHDDSFLGTMEPVSWESYL